MIRINELSFSFPTKDLYKNISFTLENKEHCAFIGASGSGKSTLIEMLLDQDKYMYDGNIDIEPNCRIGYMSQFIEAKDANSTTVFEFIAEDFINYEKKIENICAEMANAPTINNLLETYQETLDAFQAIGGDEYESLIAKKLGLASLMKHRNLMISEISGGEFKLIQIIKEMLTQPDVMIMDEPDVFLDFENLEALKNLINGHKGILLVITHNRYLLNHCFNKIIHLENKALQSFIGTYIDYNFSLLESKIELQELAIADQEEIERNEALIKQLRVNATYSSEAAKGRSLRARVKYQERLEAKQIQAPFVDIKQPNIILECEDDLEEVLAIKVTDLKVDFEDNLLSNVNLEIMSTDKVALIGSNGTGKTTLLRKIIENGSAIEIHDQVNMAYLSQIQGETLDNEASIYDAFFEAGFESYGQIKSYLFAYGFEEDILNHKIGALSGGEKNILQLAKVSSQKANMLLLDEPTSHLDTYAQLALEEAILNYKGGILMISHDYYTIANSVDYVLIIEDKTIRKMTNRKFRQMIYKNHYNKDYLVMEQEKKALETQIEMALKATNFEKAKSICETLEVLIEKMNA